MPTSPQYKKALQQLKVLEVARCRRRIQALVHEVKLLHMERHKAGVSSSDSKRLMRVEMRRAGMIRPVLTDLYNWMCEGTAPRLKIADVAYGEAEVKAMFTGVLPWSADAASVHAAAMVYHGRLYHSAKSNHDRTVEEGVLLGTEKRRVFTWLTVISGRVQRAMDAHRMAAAHVSREQEGGSSGGRGEDHAPVEAGSRGIMEGRTHDTLTDGKVYLLARWKDRLLRMLGAVPVAWHT